MKSKEGVNNFIVAAEPPEKRAKADWTQAWAVADNINNNATDGNVEVCPVCDEGGGPQTDGNGKNFKTLFVVEIKRF
jgi:hypothetical protein